LKFKSGFFDFFIKCVGQGQQRGVRGHQVTRKDQEGRPRACSKINISMINIFTLTNINTNISEGKLRKVFISEVCIKTNSLSH